MDVWVVNCMWKDYECYPIEFKGYAEVFRTELEARRYADEFRDEYPNDKCKVYKREI